MAKDHPNDELAALKAELEATKADLAKAKEKPATPPVIAAPAGVDLESFTDGEYKRSDNGEVFRLKILADAELGRTHVLKNKEHFCELTKEDFRLKFEKA